MKAIGKRVFYLFLFALTLWGIGLIGFLNLILFQETSADLKADAIIILTGGTGRIGKGFELLKKEKAHRAFISGVASPVQLEELLKIYRCSSELGEKIELDKTAVDTQSNARQTSYWIKYYGYKTIILVTSYYHIPRSVIEFQRFSQDIKIIPYPIFPAQFSLLTLLKRPSEWKTIIEEYHKYCIAKIRSFH
jgi:uncharacterized SAM-binding protein YcdF (DUF218 family)